VVDLKIKQEHLSKELENDSRVIITDLGESEKKPDY
jgi:hypothetical protein